MYVEIHGWEFEIDTADWGQNHDCGERGAHYLADWLKRQSLDRVAALWAIDQQFGDRWTNDWQVPSAHWRAKAAAEARAYKLATKGWINGSPDTGHNMSICARPRLDELRAQ